MAQYLISLGITPQLLFGVVIGMTLGFLTRVLEWAIT